MKKHFSEADLLETYYTRPGASMPVMMHLADCVDCAARYERLEKKLREAAACDTDKPETFWTRQRISVMRKIEAQRTAKSPFKQTLRMAAAAVFAFVLGGTVVYQSTKTVEPIAPVQRANIQPAVAADDPWQSEELKDFHSVVEWESWVEPNSKTNGDNSL